MGTLLDNPDRRAWARRAFQWSAISFARAQWFVGFGTPSVRRTRDARAKEWLSIHVQSSFAVASLNGKPARALLLQVLYSVRSERMLMEQLEYNLLFRWFVGLAMDDAVWAPTTFTKNRDRLLEGQHRAGLL